MRERERESENVCEREREREGFQKKEREKERELKIDSIVRFHLLWLAYIAVASWYFIYDGN